MRRWGPVLLLLLVFLASRVAALDVLPLHNDEGLHLTRAVEVWHLHPFWQINDGKIINHWAIALFYPQNAPVFAGRIATVFVGLIGLSAGCALIRRQFGRPAAFLAATLWIACPYLFFYERMALSDAESGALVVLALWASFRLAQTGQRRDAVLTGFALALATLFKFTAVPFTLAVVLIVLLMGRQAFRRRLTNLVIAAAVVALCFAVPLGYVTLHGGDFFSVALGWIGSGGSRGSFSHNISGNLARLWGQLVGMGIPLWSALTVAGLVMLALLGRKRGRVLVAAALLPLVIMIVFGSEVLPRHYVVALPAALILGAGGIALAFQAGLRRRAREIGLAAVGAALVAAFVPFAAQAYRDPGGLSLPQPERTQYLTEHSSGYGLREAVLDFPRTLARPDLAIVASMFPDSCRRANFYAADGRLMLCIDAPGRERIEAELASKGAVYVLADSAPSIGLDVATLNARATQLGAYPRPGEDAAHASVVLWLIER